MIEAYQGFFGASVGASAAFIGLLFVALSFIDNERTSDTVKAWRRILASSAFSQLVNIFFVSLAGLLPDWHSVAVVACVMAMLGLIIAIRLLPQTINRKQTGRQAPTILGLAATAVYVLQLGSAIWLLSGSISQGVWGYFVLSIILLYAGALARAWEITGIKDR